MVQQVRGLLDKPDDLSLILGTHVVEDENQLTSCPLTSTYQPPFKNTHRVNKCFFKRKKSSQLSQRFLRCFFSFMKQGLTLYPCTGIHYIPQVDIKLMSPLPQCLTKIEACAPRPGSSYLLLAASQHQSILTPARAKPSSTNHAPVSTPGPVPSSKLKQ